MNITWQVTHYAAPTKATLYEPADEEEICIEVEVAGFTFDHSELPPALAAHIERLALEDERAKRQRGYDDY
jgi:hypothetical protein